MIKVVARSAAFFAFFAYGHNSFAKCDAALALDGLVSIETCNPAKEKCIRAQDTVFEYSKKIEDTDSVFLIVGNSSPWHLYNSEFRILDLDEFAKTIRSGLTKEKKVILQTSWSGIAPGSGRKSIAKALSERLGLPVEGQDGFVWLSPDGHPRTTHQAFTAWNGGQYFVPENKDVMVSLAFGWPFKAEEYLLQKKDANGLLHVAVGWEVFNLCQDHALEVFEVAANLGQPIAAYNAALIYLERQTKADHKKAIQLLTRSSGLGDKEASKKLTSLKMNNAH
jgi:hypothetical protein